MMSAKKKLNEAASDQKHVIPNILKLDCYEWWNNGSWEVLFKWKSPIYSIIIIIFK